MNGGQVTVLAENLRFPYNVVVDGTNLYWNDAETGSIAAVPVGGGSVTTLFQGGSSAGLDLTHDATHIYFTLNDFTVRSVAKSGGGASILLPANRMFPGCTGTLCGVRPSGLLLAGGQLLIGNASPGGGASSGDVFPGAVLSMSTGGGELSNLASTGAPTSSADVVLASDGSTVFFASRGDITGNALKSVPIGGGAASTVMTIPGGMSALVAGSGSVFFAGRESSSNDFFLKRVTGANATTLAEVYFQASKSIAVDGDDIYYPKWDSATGGSIAKMSLSSGAETILVTDENMGGVAGGIAVDGSRVYWAAGGETNGDGSIRSAPKN